jgi:hypothetical protein
VTVQGNTITGNIGCGPLGDGDALVDKTTNPDGTVTKKPKPPEVIAALMALRLRNTKIIGNTIRYATTAALNIEMGADTVLVDGNKITLAGPKAVNIQIDPVFAQRGAPKNITVTNNIITATDPAAHSSSTRGTQSTS